ncbi:hypothetical protein ACPPVT_04915 [Angustibacter sp. McL0619]|uniref:hypothetical protein n=1 Tax=Angustibacter sp. McL0619 TaxID=3415676 RepID=UPI003CF31990
MTRQPDDADDTVEVLRTVWAAQDPVAAAADDDCGPTKSCRNMKDVSFDGFAEPGSDIGAAWRAKLQREGKLSTSGASVRDLVLGTASND